MRSRITEAERAERRAVRRGSDHANWKGGSYESGGRRYVSVGGRAVGKGASGYELEHRRIAADVLGKPLPKGAIVHHHDEDATNNAHHNLVVCEDRAYHNLLHLRMRARAAIGDPNGLLCSVCGKYDHRSNLRIYRDSRRGRFGERAVHPRCSKIHNRRMKERRKRRAQKI